MNIFLNIKIQFRKNKVDEAQFMTHTANSNHLDKKAVGCTKSSNLLIVREFMPS
jgi:hypothetical protein